MPAIAKKKKENEGYLTPIQREYLDILINEYHGYIPYGEKAQIARRIGCAPQYLYQLDSDPPKGFAREKERRMRECIPLADPIAQLGQLQELYDSVKAARKAKGLPLSKKDPVDIIDTARKVEQGRTAADRKDRPANVSQSINFNFQGVSDDELSEAIKIISGVLRQGGADQLGEVVEDILVNESGD